jgi:hypothetical protein
MSPGDDIAALIGVDEIRRGLGATRADPATLHLGEAEAIYVLERYHPDWTFVSDDQPAIDFARRLGSAPRIPKRCWPTATKTARSVVLQHSTSSYRWQIWDVESESRQATGTSARQLRDW